MAPSSSNVPSDEEWEAASRRCLSAICYANSRTSNWRRLEYHWYAAWDAALRLILEKLPNFYALAPQLCISDLDQSHSLGDSKMTATLDLTKGDTCIPDFSIVVMDLWTRTHNGAPNTRLTLLNKVPVEDWFTLRVGVHFIPMIVEIKRGPSRHIPNRYAFSRAISSLLREAQEDCLKQASIALESQPHLRRLMAIIAAGEWFCWTIFTREDYDFPQTNIVTTSDSSSTALGGGENPLPDPSGTAPANPASEGAGVVSAPSTRGRAAKQIAATKLTRIHKLEADNDVEDIEHDIMADDLKRLRLGSKPKPKPKAEKVPVTSGGNRWELDRRVLIPQVILGGGDTPQCREDNLPIWGMGEEWSGVMRLYTREARQQFHLIGSLLRNDILNRHEQLPLEDILKYGPDYRVPADGEDEALSDDSDSDNEDQDANVNTAVWRGLNAGGAGGNGADESDYEINDYEKIEVPVGGQEKAGSTNGRPGLLLGYSGRQQVKRG